MQKRSEMLKKLSGLLLMFCMLLCMALCTGVNAEAAQTVREDTTFMNIKQWRAGNASCIEFDALVYGEAQCSGYARAMKALCDAIGVDCRYVHANAKASNPSHQWNQVKVGGKWYILDAQSNGFLLGTNTWIKQAGMAWDTKGLPTCSKTDYKK